VAADGRSLDKASQLIDKVSKLFGFDAVLDRGYRLRQVAKGMSHSKRFLAVVLRVVFVPFASLDRPVIYHYYCKGLPCDFAVCLVPRRVPSVPVDRSRLLGRTRASQQTNFDDKHSTAQEVAENAERVLMGERIDLGHSVRLMGDARERSSSFTCSRPWDISLYGSVVQRTLLVRRGTLHGCSGLL
jgi:hypothetical protein